MSGEDWRPIPGWEGYYEVSNFGRVRSVDRWVDYTDGRRRFIEGQIRRPKPNAKGGHLLVGLNRDNHKTMRCVHALVMFAFVGPRPEGMGVCHNNGDPTDNRLPNLRYDTKSANMQDSVLHGTNHSTSKTRCKWGHPFDDANTTVGSNGKRRCRTCSRAIWHAWAERRRNATARLAH